MTPLKPIEDLTVKGSTHGPAEYALPTICQHPNCTEPARGKHHCWPKSMLKGDYWYVEIDGVIVANVVALCGSGTTGHHGAVEDHDAWIKFEEGIFVWYDRVNGECPTCTTPGQGCCKVWDLVGPLNPQPGDTLGKPKRKKFAGEARRQRRTISVKVPQDTEDGGAIWDETLEQVKGKLIADGLYVEGADIPIYEALIAALRDWIDS